MKTILNCSLGIMSVGLMTGCACGTRAVTTAQPMAMMSQERQEQSAVRDQALALRSINFAFDRSDLSESSKAILKRNAELLQTNNTRDVTIGGHTDERGTNSYNIDLGKRRAMAAASYLISLGIAPERISTTNCGEECPLNTNHNETAWAENRRVEFEAAAK